MWARMLEDKAFLDHFINTNQKRLAMHYTVVTKFLEQHDIPYFPGGNAALFVWVDLRKWLLGDSKDVSSLLMSSAHAEQLKAKQDLMYQAWHKKGVMIAKGSAFLTEELGWFRIVFTAEEEALRIGLQRFVDVLQEMKGDGRFSSA